MNTPTNLQDRLPSLLGELADATPLEPDDVEFDPFRLTALVSNDERKPQRNWVRVAVGAAAAVLLVAGLALVARPGTDGAPAAAPPAWTPPGTEFPSTDLGPATYSDRPVVAALTRSIGIEGHPPQTITRSLTYAGHATAVEVVCIAEHWSGGCGRAPSSTPRWSTGITSSVDNGFATFDLWEVEGLPPEAAYVTYTDGQQALWQRPIAGFAAFPRIAGTDEMVVAFDATGNELGRFDSRTEFEAFPNSAASEVFADLSQAQFEDLVSLTDDEMERCLISRGGTLSGDVASFAEGVDQVAVWEQCVEGVQQIVGEAVTELAPRFYDSVSERPLNPDPAITYSD